MNTTRLFDLLDDYKERFPGKELLHAKKDGAWKGMAIETLIHQSDQLAASFLRLGISKNNMTPESQDKISIISKNRPEWLVTDFAAQKVGAILVPIYPSISPADLAYILKEAETKLLFIADKKLYRRVSQVLDQVPSLKGVYTYDEVDGANNWKELLQDPSEEELNTVQKIKDEVKEDDVSTFIYTSGTTGNPKGAMLTHKNILSNVRDSIHCFNFTDANGKALSFLPLNHIFERMVTYLYIKKGVSIYYAEGMETIGDNLREVKPVVFTTVPRLLEKVYEKIEAKGNQLEGFKRKVFDWSVKLALQFDVEKSMGPLYNLKLAVADKLVYSKWREAVGGDVKAIVTGSAACQVKLLRIFTAAKLIVMEGYGLTESSPVISVNTYQKEGRRFGSVGKIIKNVSLKIAEDGEILFKGDNVMKGYYKNPTATAEMLQDGWLHTGDIGTYTDDGFLKITDRKKELFKISGGKYVAPLPLENKIKESPYIEQLMVVGSNEKFVGAIIVPSLMNLKEFFENQGSPLPKTVDITQDPEVLKLIRKELNSYNVEFADHERVKRFQLVDQEWTIDGGELTPTLKLKRRKIYEKYGHLLDKIYNN